MLGYLYDVADVHNYAIIKRILGPVVAGLFTFSTIMLCINSPSFSMPLAVSLAAWLFSGLFALLFLYSAFIETAPVQQVQGNKKRVLVTSGTYALSRHPTAIWSILAISFLTIASRSIYLLLSLPLWIIMELLWIWLQDRFFLPAIFPGYQSYRNRTPMLIPTKKSLKQCLASFQMPVCIKK